MNRLLSCLAFAALLGCERSTPDYCCTDLATCQEASGTPALRPCTDPVRSFCDNSGGFPASEEVGRTCIAEPGGRSCDAPADCATPQAPVCDLAGEQVCTGCTAASECAPFEGRPLCHPTSGACVECVGATDCPVQRPTCDPDGLCRECTRDNECNSQLCNLVLGSCVPEDEVLYVGQGGTGTACTRTETCGSIQTAVDLVTTTRRNIHVSSGSYEERVTADAVSFYLSGVGAELHAPIGEAGPVLSVTGASVVELFALRIRNAEGVTGDGVDCVGPLTTVTLRGVIVEGNANYGIESSSCRLSVIGARIEDNLGGGVKVTGGDVTLQNNFITRNGAPTVTFGGLDLSNPATMVVEFNTVADNVAAGGLAAGIQCLSTLPRLLSSNIVVGAGPSQGAGMNCEFVYTVSNQVLAGTGNLTTPPTFVDGTNGNYHLAAGSAGIDVGDPAATLTTDVDGDLRPQGVRADVGADEVVP